MPPKIKITKNCIIDTAMEIVRRNGEASLNTRLLASVLNCSTQPIFSNFSSMDELRLAVIYRADQLSQQYMDNEILKGEYPAYKASGMAYIRFAKEEKELFKLLYMRDRSREAYIKESEITDKMEAMIHNNTGLDGSDAQLFHLEMWAYVHGIAVMFATGFLDLDWDLVSKMLTDCYQGLKKQYGME